MPPEPEKWSKPVSWILFLFAVACAVAAAFGVEPMYPFN